MYKTVLTPLAIQQPGTNITTSGTSASAAIPNDASGVPADYVAVTCTAACYIRVGTGAPTAAAGDFHLPAGVVVVLSVHGNTHIAAIQVAAGGTLTVTPLEA